MINAILQMAAQHARLLLVAGLVAGMVLPGLAHFMKDYLAHLIAGILFLNAFRIGYGATVGTKSDIGTTLGIALVLQLLVPCVLILAFLIFGITGSIATAVLIMAAAPSISGSPNITHLLHHDPAPSLRLLIIGTAIVPLTIVPVFFLSPNLGSPELVTHTALRLLLIIAVSTGLAFVIRHLFWRVLSGAQENAVDGLSVIVMAIVVVGLMSALGPAMTRSFHEVLIVLAVAFAANLLLQIAFYFLLSAKRFRTERVGISVVAGNRNMALFLAALPTSVTDPLLLFIACYQFPMYLTPIIMARFYRLAP